MASVADQYIQLWSMQEHLNWDAALTLGTCGIMICRLAYRPINWVWRRWAWDPEVRIRDQKLAQSAYNLLLGLFIIAFMCFGITCAVVLLGYWSAAILEFFHIPQGVIRPYTSEGLVPYN